MNADPGPDPDPDPKILLKSLNQIIDDSIYMRPAEKVKEKIFNHEKLCF
jgi:hypothetical protein